MDNELQKASMFMKRLWGNSTLVGLSPLQKEAQLQEFLSFNANALRPAMSSPVYFPNVPWNHVKQLMEKALRDITNAEFSIYIQNILDNHLNTDFIRQMTKSSASPNSIKQQIKDFIHKIATAPESRKELTGPLICIETGLIEKYMTEILRAQQYISLELFKVERIRIDESHVAELLKTVMLLRPCVHFAPHHNITGLHITSKIAQKVREETERSLSLLPPDILKSAVNSYLVFHENPEMGASSCLAAIFSNRCRNLNPKMQHMRGAESTDKSWFSVTRKNYKYFGFDLSMLTELQFIAGENRW